MYRKMMVPVDGSELAECVLPHVENIAKGGQVREIIFVRVIEPPVAPSTGVTKEAVKMLRSQAQADAEKYLGQIVNRISYRGVATLGSRLLFGKAAETLAEFAAGNEVDLIVMATHGRSGISRWTMGSVAERLLRSVCIPVLMVRAPGCGNLCSAPASS